MNKLKRVIILMTVFALFIPALSTAKMTKHDEKATSARMMDEKHMEMMHNMMPVMMRDMMDTMHEMMGMMKGYDETMKKAEDAGDKMAGDEKKARVLTRTSKSGDVAVDVTYLNPGEDSPAFNIKLDTHSLDLDQYKLEAIVSLRDDKGKEYANPAVESPSGSGHHRSGVVRFKGVDISGATAIYLVIKDMAGAKERVFRFDIK
ncbi:MAG: hypothetical protein HZA08_11625 [Nitrospirae bacterium]|nr:hypothetical protein [Nitrospirota bacterium]